MLIRWLHQAKLARLRLGRYLSIVPILSRPAGDDLQGFFGQRPLQRRRFAPRRSKPHAVLLCRGEQHRHGLGWIARRCRSHPWSGSRRADARRRPCSPLARARRARSSRSRRRRTAAAPRKREPGRRLSRLCIGPLAKRIHRHQAAAFRAEPRRQCGLFVLRMFVTGAPPNCGGPGMPQGISSSCRSPSATRRSAQADPDRRRAAAAG